GVSRCAGANNPTGMIGAPESYITLSFLQSLILSEFDFRISLTAFLKKVKNEAALSGKWSML
ncbi:MAG TPA: hypothetical protein PKX55_22500, partial [Leptospiraceae bacterium]|nr:hypothetical protein [Leptospiraceae bacterium]